MCDGGCASGKPHNPMINTGALVLCSLIKPHCNITDRTNFVSAGTLATLSPLSPTPSPSDEATIMHTLTVWNT